METTHHGICGDDVELQNIVSTWPPFRTGLVIDDTGSMSNELAGVKSALTNFIATHNTDPNKILTSIKEVLDGGSPMSSTIARKVISSFHTNDHESPLSIRETEVLKKLCEGQNYKVIADSLFVSGNTVRMHIKNIYKKLHVHSRGEAVKKAIEDRLI